LTPRFSANRAVREYTEQLYLPGATAYRLRIANKGEIGTRLTDWKHRLQQKWAALHFGEVKAETHGEQHAFAVQVYLDDLTPEAVGVELYADAVTGGAPVRQDMSRDIQTPGTSGWHVYRATVPASRPQADFTARLIPHFDGVAIPLEETRILWQR
jgi:starch phosphorylase